MDSLTSNMKFPTTALNFIQQLEHNNNKVWFTENKEEYQNALLEAKNFALDIFNQVKETDVLENKQSLKRIYRDIRFSKDKTPYKKYWAGGLKRESILRRGGYYWHIEPSGTEEFDDKSIIGFAGGGFWGPDRKDLLRIRTELANDYVYFNQLLATPPISTYFKDLYRKNSLKVAPKGFDKNHEAIDLLRLKSFILIRPFTKKEVQSENFSIEISNTFIAMRPFLDYMTDVLTTNENGESIY